MTGCVNKVQLVQLAVLAAIVKADGLCLDGDASLAFEIHAVEHLRLHLALAECARVLDETVGDGGFAVVDVGDDGKIADMLLIHCVSFDFCVCAKCYGQACSTRVCFGASQPSFFHNIHHKDRFLPLYYYIEHVALRVCDENLNLSAFGREFCA